MIYRIGRKKYQFYAFDIESHNDIESIKKMETSMWLGCFIDENSSIDDESSYLYNMNQFIDRIEYLSNRHRHSSDENRPIKNIAIYIYNLSFEWSFILPVLLERGYHFEEIFTKDTEKAFNSVSTRSVSSVWEVHIKTSKTSGDVVIRDLSKIFGGGLGKVAKSFGLETQKGEIDYRLNRLHMKDKDGNEIAWIPTKEEKIYCFKDTKIIMEILMIMKQREDKNFFSCMSMASYSMKMMIKTGWSRSIKPYKEFRNLYPFLGEAETKFLRNSVSGGICYACSNYQFKEINEPIIHIDAHSMHPSSAYLNLFPYGFGEYGKGEPSDYFNHINCCHIRISYTGVKIHSIIKLIGFEFVDDFELTVWDFEIDTMKKCYENLEVEYIDYYAYKIKPLKWRKYYSWCFNQRLKAKAEGDTFNVLYFKLLMNSSYGKLLENPHLELFENIIDEDGIITSKVSERQKPESMSEDDWQQKCLNAKYTYLPVGSCIPAYSRVCLIELALKIGWDKVVYFDTDSIFFIKTPETEANMNKYMPKENFLGGWAIEEIIDKAQFTAPKRYKAEVGGKSYFKMGGFNLDKYAKDHNIKINDIPFDEVNIISSKWEVQRAFRCKGGTIIDFQEKEIGVVSKYLEIFNRNT